VPLHKDRRPGARVPWVTIALIAVNVTIFLFGLMATGAHIAVQPSATVPIVGASGAIAGAMGAYLVLFPNNRLWSPDLPVVGAMASIRAKWFLGFWFVLQFFTNPAEGVAWVAHVGGFVFGAMVALVFGDRLRPTSDRSTAPAA